MDYHKTPISYGLDTIDEFIPCKPGIQVKYITGKKIKLTFKDVRSELQRVLEKPVNSSSLATVLEKVYNPGKLVSLIVDDYSRANDHTKILLPLILDYLFNHGVIKEDIRILVAAGTHRKSTEKEFRQIILGDKLYSEYKNQIVNHQATEDNCDYLGITSVGTPIYINKVACQSCIVMPITDSEGHYFAGQAGTVKSFCPGIAGNLTILKNHPRMFDKEIGFKPECRLLNTKGNPVISEMIEIAQIFSKKVPIFGIDCLYQEEDKIIYLNAGEIVALHNAAGKVLPKVFEITVDAPADLVIVSPGKALGINLYQSGKATHAGWNAVRKDGKGQLVLVAPCTDGSGNKGYQEVMTKIQGMNLKQALSYVIDNYCSEKTFIIGNQKPVDVLRILLTVGENNVYVLSEMNSEELKAIYRFNAVIKQPKESPRDALRTFVKDFIDHKPDARIYVLPDAGLYVNFEKQTSSQN